MGKHAFLSMSGASAWMACPAKPSREFGQPDTSSYAAQEGTVCHLLMAKSLTEDKPPETYLGDILDDSKIPVDDDMCAAVQMVILHINKALEVDPSIRVFCEVQVSMVKLGLPDCWGTADIVLLGTKQAETVDLKYGRMFVDAQDNRQLQGYMIAAMATMHDRNTPHPAGAKMTIIQPRCEGVEAIRSQTVPMDWMLSEVAPWYVQMGLFALSDDPAAIPGESQCRYCKAHPSCPEAALAAMDAVQGMFPDNRIADNAAVDTAIENATEAALAEPNELTQEQRNVILDNEGLILGWIKSVRAYEHEQLAAGIANPRYKLVAGSKRRAWDNDKKVFALLGKLGVKPKERKTVAVLLSVAQIENKFKKELHDNWEQIEAHIATTTGSPKMVSMSNKNPSVVDTLSEGFSDNTTVEGN